MSRTLTFSSVRASARSEHWATALSRDRPEGPRHKALHNDEERLRALYKNLATHGNLLVVVDQLVTIRSPGSAEAQVVGITVD